MEKVAPNSKFVGHSTEIIRQIKIKGPLLPISKYAVLVAWITKLAMDFQ